MNHIKRSFLTGFLWIALLSLPVSFWGCSSLRDSLSGKPATQPAEAVVAEAPAEAVVEAPSTQPVQPIDTSTIARIRDEGMNRSQVMKTMSYLTDVIGPRLTGSPNLRRANEWTRDRLASWGLVNAAVEPWGEFGRGWTLKRFSAEVIEPQAIPLIAFPRAWSPGLDQPIEAEVIHFNPRSTEEMEAFAGKLEGKIVMIGNPRVLRAQFTAAGQRYSDQQLEQMARGRGGRGGRGPATQPELVQNDPGARRGGRGRGGPGTAPATNPAGAQNIADQLFGFAVREKAAVVLSNSTNGDGGTIFVQTALTPGRGGGRGRGPSIYSMEAPATVPQVMLAAEHFNRLVRMLEAGEKVKMAINLQVQYLNDDLKAYNTVAEIPGTDLKDEIVMLGGHMDSWHSGTGATDNGAGVAVAMEAVRILKALNIQPRRTIRIALWTGEEQGLIGSREYVTKHFGSARGGRGRGGDAAPPPTPESPGTPTTQPEVLIAGVGSVTPNSGVTSVAGVAQAPATQPEVQLAGGAVGGDAPAGQAARGRGRGQGGGGRGRGGGGGGLPQINKQPDYDKFSVYFNLDNGTGKIRGVYAQGNPNVVPIFREWLRPFHDLGATTVTTNNTMGTDHLSFDNVGLPGFQFIQDQIEYSPRTHHSNMDVFDRIQEEDMKQAATIMAAFVYNAAMMDQKMPKKAGF